MRCLVALSALLQSCRAAIVTPGVSRQRLAALLALLTLLTLTGCGWQLRSQAPLVALDWLALSGGEARTRYAVESVLLERGVRVANTADTQLRISNERWQSRTIALDELGRAAGTELRYRLDWQLYQAGQPLLARRQLELVRSFHADPNNALATSDEENLTRKALREQAARVLVDQLAATSRHLPALSNDDPPAEASDAAAP